MIPVSVLVLEMVFKGGVVEGGGERDLVNLNTDIIFINLYPR